MTTRLQTQEIRDGYNALNRELRNWYVSRLECFSTAERPHIDNILAALKAADPLEIGLDVKGETTWGRIGTAVHDVVGGYRLPDVEISEQPKAVETAKEAIIDAAHEIWESLQVKTTRVA